MLYEVITLAPTVKINIHGDSSEVDYSYGVNGNGLGGWADISANLNVNPSGVNEKPLKSQRLWLYMLEL